MAKKKLPLRADELRDRLRERWPSPEWVVLDEVRSCTGFNRAERYTDLMALSTYPSRGLRLIGCELKSSRSDLKKELTSPDKAREMQQWCDAWYLVLGRADLIQDGELPPKWGLIVPAGKGLKVVSPAAELKPQLWPRDFVASMLRSAHKQKPALRVIEKAVKEARESEGAHIRAQLKRAKESLQSFQSAVSEFNRASGIQVTEWMSDDRAKLEGEKFRRFREMGLEGAISFARATAERFERAASELRKISDPAMEGFT